MIFIIAIFLMLAAILATISNPDVLSPAKFFLFFFLAFHIGALFTPISIITGSLIFVVLCVGMVAVALETSGSARSAPVPIPAAEPIKQRDYAFFLWGLSLVPMATQIYMIQHFGGLEGYFRSISLRVVEWAGFGWARTLIAFLVPINLAYFAIGIRQRRPLGWWAPYGVHFLLLVGMGLLAGSRSILLNVFILQLLAYNYLYTRVRGQTAGLLATGLLLAAMTLGVLRNIVRFEGGTFSAVSSTADRASSFASFYYGVDPLEIIVNTEHPTLAGGSTFFSLLTNVIPRSLWPNKPDTGGVFFTQNYVGDIWLGFSNQTPTFLGEWIINFGWALGIIGFFLSYGLIIFLIYKGYRSLLDRLKASRADALAIDTVIYGCVVLAFVGLMVGELTNVVISLLTAQLLPLWGIRWYVSRKQSA
jgi:oligosaccharide repeat unit polymerase